MAMQTRILVGPVRLLILFGLLLAFYLWGGFDKPEVLHYRWRRSWIGGIVVFCAGAFSATMLDVVVGLIDRTSQRLFCIICGALAMGAAILFRLLERVRFGPEDTAGFLPI